MTNNPAPLRNRCPSCGWLTRAGLVAASREIWGDVERAIRAVAAARGWTHANSVDIEEAARKLEAENPNSGIWQQLFHAQAFQDNIRQDVMQEGEDWDDSLLGVEIFIETLTRLYPEVRELDLKTPGKFKSEYWDALEKINAPPECVTEDAKHCAMCGRMTQEGLKRVSLEIWEEVEQTIRAIAVSKGWFCAGSDDVDNIVRLMAVENPAESDRIMTRFMAASSLDLNAQHAYMEEAELKGSIHLAKKFINYLETLYPDAKAQT